MENEQTEAQKGYINTQYTVWCGKCSRWEQISAPTKAFAAVVFREDFGWKKTKAHGWLCPKDARKLAGKKAGR